MVKMLKRITMAERVKTVQLSPRKDPLPKEVFGRESPILDAEVDGRSTSRVRVEEVTKYRQCSSNIQTSANNPILMKFERVGGCQTNFIKNHKKNQGNLDDPKTLKHQTQKLSKFINFSTSKLSNLRASCSHQSSWRSTHLRTDSDHGNHEIHAANKIVLILLYSSCGPYPAVLILRSLSCGPYPAVLILRSLSCGPYPVVLILWFLSCGPYPAVLILRSLSCGPYPAVLILRSLSCGPYPAVLILRSLSCGSYPAVLSLRFLSCGPYPVVLILRSVSCAVKDLKRERKLWCPKSWLQHHKEEIIARRKGGSLKKRNPRNVALPNILQSTRKSKRKKGIGLCKLNRWMLLPDQTYEDRVPPGYDHVQDLLRAFRIHPTLLCRYRDPFPSHISVRRLCRYFRSLVLKILDCIGLILTDPQPAKIKNLEDLRLHRVTAGRIACKSEARSRTTRGQVLVEEGRGIARERAIYHVAWHFINGENNLSRSIGYFSSSPNEMKRNKLRPAPEDLAREKSFRFRGVSNARTVRSDSLPFEFDFDYEFDFLFHCEFDFDFDNEFDFLFHCEFDFDFDEFDFLFQCFRKPRRFRKNAEVPRSREGLGKPRRFLKTVKISGNRESLGKPGHLALKVDRPELKRRSRRELVEKNVRLANLANARRSVILQEPVGVIHNYQQNRIWLECIFTERPPYRWSTLKKNEGSRVELNWIRQGHLHLVPSCVLGLRPLESRTMLFPPRTCSEMLNTDPERFRNYSEADHVQATIVRAPPFCKIVDLGLFAESCGGFLVF
ncbi:unnamed protein product [Nesidiocoris tenuis]|uniref:Uncharacterized protein n=1 Tax=Nesidiocoris tenuis TaxID=355587 RepID=A0A6H5HI43_9HEMI|nr:unnamed protein product [Nesidiocoris tenuis]